ncbi:MAG: DUF1905 domain-containing protein [Clostridia bacterium]|nr:DUF1905 domain-containing protein [Clostridia bacterium]
MKEYRFTAEILKNPEMDAAYIVFPYDLRRETGKGRLAVHALFDGVPYSGSIVNMGVKDTAGNICYVIGIPKAVRVQIGKSFGQQISVVIKERSSP